MRILLYYQNPYRTVFIESLLKGFVGKGHEVYLLTTCPAGPLHEVVAAFGVNVYTATTHNDKKFSYINNALFLIKFCKTHHIEVVYSHLQNANLIALIASPFIKAKVFPCRHHMDDVRLGGNRNGKLIDKLVNALAKKLIIVSAATRNYLINIEKVKPEKIIAIPLGYDFDLYGKINPQEVQQIRDNCSCKLLLIIIGRMVVNKNHITAFKVLNALVNAGLDIKMIVMDQGPEQEKLLTFVAENKLSDRLFFTGFKNSIIDYIAASDILICPSISEASNQVVKEAGILGKPGIVIKGVGDFDEYIISGKNGFVVSTENTEQEMVALLADIYNGKYNLGEIGDRQKQVVQNKFSIGPVVDQYLKLGQ